MSYAVITARTSSNLASSADINQLMQNIIAMVGDSNDPITTLKALNSDKVPIGSIFFCADSIPPENYLELDGSFKDRDTYGQLYAKDGTRFGDILPAAGETFSANAGTDLITLTSSLSEGNTVKLYTTDTLPAPLEPNTKYYVRNPSGATCQLSETPSGAIIDITDTGTGTHTIKSNMFQLLDMRGEFARGWSHGSIADPDRASRTGTTGNNGTIADGDNVGTGQLDELKAHSHSNGATYVGVYAHWTSDYYIFYPSNTGITGGNETRGRNKALMFIIKYKQG
jgi:hypothetical protein